MYASIINLVPYAVQKQFHHQVLDWAMQTWSTLAYSVDDALSLVSHGGSGSFIKVWNGNLLSFEDMERLLNSGLAIEWKHLPGYEPNIVDVIASLETGETPYYRRELDDIIALTIHHTVGWSYDQSNHQNAHNIAHYHVATKGWPGIGYHYLIGPDGEILQINDLNTISYHSANNNFWSAGICLGGDFRNHQPNEAQIHAASALVAYLKKDLNSHVAVIPHKRMPDSSTICPGEENLDEWLKVVAGTIKWI